MLRAKNIIYGYCLRTTPNKYKYLISIYRSDELNIVAVFPTSQKRSGSSSPVHGANMRDGNIVSYVFKGNVSIGYMPNSEEPFSFHWIRLYLLIIVFGMIVRKIFLRSLEIWKL